MKNPPALYALLPLEYWQPRSKGKERDRGCTGKRRRRRRGIQYGIPSNVGRRKWRKYKALIAFGGTGCIDFHRLAALIDRKCCINTCATATNPPNSSARNNRARLCWNSIHSNGSRIIQFNAPDPRCRLFLLPDHYAFRSLARITCTPLC